MKKLIYFLLGAVVMVAGTVYAAPSLTYLRTVLPEATDAFDLGTTTRKWRSLYLTGSDGCLQLSSGLVGSTGTACGSGGGAAGVISTTTALANTQVVFSTGVASIGNDSAFTYNATSDRLTVTNASTTVQTISGNLYVDGTTRLATSLTGLLKATSGVVSTAVSGTDIKTINGSSILGSGDLTVTGGSGLSSTTPWTLGNLVVANSLGSVTTISTSTLKTSQLTNDAGFLTSALTSYDAWTHPSAGISATTSQVTVAGLLSTASSTISSDLRLSSLSTGGLAVGTGGLVYTGATTTAGTGLTYSGNAFNVSTSQNIATLSNLTSNGFVKTSGGTGALSIDTSTYLTAITGGTCTNQFVRVLSTAGVITCATVANTDLANSTISGIALGSNLADLTATNGTLTFSGTYNGGTARTIGLNLGNANTWTVNQTFNYSSSTTYSSFAVSSSTTSFIGTLTGAIISATQRLVTVISAAFTPATEGEIGIDTTSNQFKYFSGGAVRVVSPTLYPAFTYATSTAWNATTTIPLGPAFVAETWTGVQCFTDTGTLNVSFYDGTNRMNMFNASTTVGTVTLSSNNSFTASEKRYVDIGTPASSPTKISCTLSKTIDAN